jgi:hypothetical protein
MWKHLGHDVSSFFRRICFRHVVPHAYFAGNMWVNWKTFFRDKNVSEFIGKHFSSAEANFVSATMYPKGGQTGKH